MSSLIPARVDGENLAGRLIDPFSRSISYLRLSITDQCNLRCLYCTPKDTFAKLPSRDLLTYEEIIRVVKVAVGLGIRKVRLTGGEPLVRRGVIGFIQALGSIAGLDDVRLTTNGTFLDQYLGQLQQAGIRKINISLDTLRRDRYRQITGADLFDRVWGAIKQALEMGFSPLKINVVAMAGINDDELIDFARLSMELPLQVRFIEFMPIGNAGSWDKARCITAAEIKAKIAAVGRLEPVEQEGMDGPARIYRVSGAAGSLGFITPISEHFCDRCNRLRLTSEGRLRSCLLNDRETDLKSILRRNCGDDEIRETLIRTILDKPKGHRLKDVIGDCHGRMSRIGG